MCHVTRCGVIALALTCALAAPAAADLGQYDKESYPKALVERPLVLAPEMLELRIGAATDAVGNELDRINTRLDLLYGLGTRFQLGFESVLAALPTDSFQVADIATWAEYNIIPRMSARAGVYMRAPRDPATDELDAQFGGRLGLPMKFPVTSRIAVVANPTASFGDGDGLEVPVGGQLQLVSALAFTLETGMVARGYEFGSEALDVPLAAGLQLSITRQFDVGAKFWMTDVAHSGPAGRDDRWLVFAIAFRG
jgi:hypothetical protein